MTTTDYSKFRLIVNNIYKTITLFVFLILPKRISVIFTSLSIISIILSIQKRKINLEDNNIKKLEKLLNISLCGEILLFPNYTLEWFWNKEFLEQEIVINDKKIKLYEAIAYKDLFNTHIGTILNIFIDNLPRTLKFKLNINNTIDKIYLKHNIIKSILYI